MDKRQVLDGKSVTGGTGNTTLNIKFTSHGDYTIKANFTLPGNVPYSVYKSVKGSIAKMRSYYHEYTTLLVPGEHVSFYLEGAPAGATVQWHYGPGSVYGSGGIISSSPPYAHWFEADSVSGDQFYVYAIVNGFRVNSRYYYIM